MEAGRSNRGGQQSQQQISALEFDEAKETMESKQQKRPTNVSFCCVVLYEMSQILNCGLDQRTLTILAGLIENGVNPEALAAVVKELKRETEALKVGVVKTSVNGACVEIYRQQADNCDQQNRKPMQCDYLLGALILIEILTTKNKFLATLISTFDL